MKGRPWVAYLSLHDGTDRKIAKTRALDDDQLLVHYSAKGRPVGVEILSPSDLSLERLNQLLDELGEEPMPENEYAPLRAA
jgi:uncharacterized protein YuzE